MIAAGEWDDALHVMEVVSCYPPPGHRQASQQQQQQQQQQSSATSGDCNGNGASNGGGGNGDGKGAEEVDYFGLDAHLVFHQIEDGDDARLDLLADLIRPPAGSVGDDVPPALINAVHPISRLAVLLGIVHDELGNPSRSATFLRSALRIDPRNVQALDHCLHRRIMDKDQERSMILNLNFDGVPGGEFLRDVYLAKLGFAPADAAIVGYEPSENDNDNQNDKMMATDQDETAQPATNGNKDTTLLSPNVILQQQTPNLTFMGGHAMDESSIQLEESQMMSPAQLKEVKEHGEDDRKPAAAVNTPAADGRVPLTPSDEINRSLVRLTSHPDLSSSSEILSLAAIHAYAKYDLPLTLSYCQLLEKADPYCQNAAYVHISALASLGYKRPLFQLAHRLVDSSPKAAKSWYAVGSYYYACGRYDLAQRHFCRAARLDPRSSECWIAFGCSFAACDESDQALASYRAASRLNPGDHYPLLYMGMEYVRTNHLSLASHFLKSAWRVSGNTDPLVRSEMGVLHYRKGEWEDAATCFVHAVRLVAEMTLDREGGGEETGVGGSTLMRTGANNMEVDNDAENTPHGRGRQSIGNPPMTSVRFAKNTAAADVSTFSHHLPRSHSAPQHSRSKRKSELSDIECIQLCRDAYWEPTIFNLGQSYRKIRMFDEAAACFEKSLSICPGKASSYSALGFTRHLNGDLDGAIEAYHQSLSRKPDDPFCSEMLMRALNESLHYPQSNPIFDDEIDASQDESFLSGAGNGNTSGYVLSPRGRASSAAASASFLSGHYSESRMSASASNFTFDSGTDVEMG
jgi:tetratricopeptide (TPR) repeat protein